MCALYVYMYRESVISFESTRIVTACKIYIIIALVSLLLFQCLSHTPCNLVYVHVQIKLPSRWKHKMECDKLTCALLCWASIYLCMVLMHLKWVKRKNNKRVATQKKNLKIKMFAWQIPKKSKTKRKIVWRPWKWNYAKFIGYLLKS